MKERIERLKNFGDNLPFAKVYFREDWQVFYFDLDGKMFGLMNKPEDSQPKLTIKGTPEKNELLREQYADVYPGYHTNKQHWNSILLATNEISDEELENMIEESYRLVRAKLPAGRRKFMDSN